MDTTTDRRTILKGAALGVALAVPRGALAEADPALLPAVAAGHDAAIARLREWIALPTIAAERRNIEPGYKYMMQLATDAGFEHVERVPTDGVPGVFATMNNGAKKTLALYFMYDVKQFDPAEWSSPPLEGAARRPARTRQGDDRSRRDQSEGARGDRPRRAPRL